MSRVSRTQGPPCLDAQSTSNGQAGELQRIVGSIGLKVFSLRKRMGLSLQQLGERSDVSAAAIHKIEQGGMVPTITTLLKIAGALGRPVSYFVEEDVGQDDVAVLTRADETRPVYTSHEGITLHSISGPYGRYLLAGARATVVPGATSGRKPMQHPGEELVHVTGAVSGSGGSRVARRPGEVRMIADILPAGAVAAESFGPPRYRKLLPAEAAAIATANPARRTEFAAGRAVARAALAGLDVPAGPILPGRAGEPRWPDGVVGSITHCAGYRACAVARAQ